jgi:hypothetical protein
VNKKPLTVWTEPARLVVFQRQAVPYRIWLIGKALDSGSGVLLVDELSEEGSAYGLNERQVGSALNAADGLFLSVCKGQVFLRGYRRLAEVLGVSAPGRIVEIPAGAIPRIGVFRAHLYAAWLGTRQVSRKRLSTLFNVSLPTLRRWEGLAGVFTATTTVQMTLDDAEGLLLSEFENHQGDLIASLHKQRSWFECTTCDWRGANYDNAIHHVRDGNCKDFLVVTQGPNHYRSPLPQIWHVGTGRGQLKSMRRRPHSPGALVWNGHVSSPGYSESAGARIPTLSEASNSKVAGKGQRRLEFVRMMKRGERRFQVVMRKRKASNRMSRSRKKVSPITIQTESGSPHQSTKRQNGEGV